MYTQKLIPQEMYSYYIDSNGGELILGGIDSTKYTGQMTYAAVNSIDYWQVSMTSVTVGNTKLCSRCSAIVDSGTTLILGPSSEVQTLHNYIGGAQYLEEYGLYYVSCRKRALSTFPTVTFTINGVAFSLTPLQYLSVYNGPTGQDDCYSAFVPVNTQVWTLGDTFLQRFYSSYDLTNNRVGFATSVNYNNLPTVPSDVFKATG